MRDKKELIEETINFWQPYYERQLSEDDAVEVIANVTQYFKTLARLKNNNGNTSRMANKSPINEGK